MNKIKKRKIVTVSLIIFFLIVSLIAYIEYYTYYVEESLGFIGNKDFNIIISENDITDYSYIYSRPMSAWDRNERQKLADYMKENNLKISPGEYKLHQRDRFEKVLKILKFDKINVVSYYSKIITISN